MNYLAQGLDQRGYVPVAEDKPAICNPCSPCVHNISGHLQIFLYGFTLQSACNGDAGRNRLDHFGKTVQVTGIVGLDQIYSEFRGSPGRIGDIFHTVLVSPSDMISSGIDMTDQRHFRSQGLFADAAKHSELLVLIVTAHNAAGRELDFVLDHMKFLGCRGTTGTEASFMDLFDGDGAKIDEMNRQIAAEFGFEQCYAVCGQTYPRKADSRILNCLSAIAQSCYRMANDIRLLQHDRQVEEPFEKNQIGSSAMAYKRNPMRSERICSLSRYLMADAMNAPMTASVQWLERTLDDSANRRISMPEGFLCADAILRLSQNVTDGLHVNEKIVDRTCREYLPFIATENLMMEGVKRGGDRQALHEIIRTCSMAATARMKEGEPCDLLSRLAAEPAFGMTEAEMEAVLDPKLYIGRCPEQVDAFLAQVRPLLSGASREVPEISL